MNWKYLILRLVAIWCNSFFTAMLSIFTIDRILQTKISFTFMLFAGIFVASLHGFQAVASEINEYLKNKNNHNCNNNCGSGKIKFLVF